MGGLEMAKYATFRLGLATFDHLPEWGLFEHH
jgi:hypothetical protein